MKFLLFLLFLLPLTLPAQIGNGSLQPAYTYDAAGNRIQRQLVWVAGGPGTNGGSGGLRAAEPAPQVRVFPNPPAGRLQVQPEAPLAGARLWLLDLQGRTLHEAPLPPRGSKLDLRPYPAGTYLLRVQAEGYREEWQVVRE